MLAANSFGPYRTLLRNATYSPMMAVYLSHLKNQARSGTINPDENFAREIMQLFSTGLVQRHLDGSLKLDPSTGLPLATYDQADITEMARVMTGLSFSVRHNLTSAPTYPANTNQRIGTLVTNTDFFTNNGHLWWQSQWTSDLAMFPAPRLQRVHQLHRPHLSGGSRFRLEDPVPRQAGPEGPPHKIVEQRERQRRHRRCPRRAGRSSEHRSVHLPAVDPAAGHIESQPRIHSPGRNEIQG